MNHKQNTASQYDSDLEICEAATEGPWVSSQYGTIIYPNTGNFPICMDVLGAGNAEYIAHFNPTYVTQLIKKAQRCEELEVALVNAQAILSDLAIEHEDLF